jgi:hypothetical protein
MYSALFLYLLLSNYLVIVIIIFLIRSYCNLGREDSFSILFLVGLCLVIKLQKSKKKVEHAFLVVINAAATTIFHSKAILISTIRNPPFMIPSFLLVS